LAAARHLRSPGADRLSRPNTRRLSATQRRVVLHARRAREARGERRLLPEASRLLVRCARSGGRPRAARLLPRLGRGVPPARRSAHAAALPAVGLERLAPRRAARPLGPSSGR
jgi:hypothetical protein